MPAIVITSNREQELPTAFKGRCIYHYIQFPDAEKMRLIVSKHHPKVSNKIVESCFRYILPIKKDWSGARSNNQRTTQLVAIYVKTFSTQEALSKINALDGLGTLIKTQADLRTCSASIWECI